MPQPSGYTHTPNAPSLQFRGRDSRVVSIYDKYLYDPKDLESSDPRRRELARKASKLRLQGRMANMHEANGQTPPQRKSIAFAQGTKAHDRPQEHPEQDRDSGAWGLGQGMLDNMSSDSDSDSENGHRGKRQSDSRTNPDTASQNPTSSKLMRLNSAKDNGMITPASGTRTLDSSSGVDPERQRRIPSTSDYGDNNSRHGSTINFGAGRDSLESRGVPQQLRPSQDGDFDSQGSRPISPKTALTRQLGLATLSPAAPGSQQQVDHFAGAQPPPGPGSMPNASGSQGPGGAQNPFHDPSSPPAQDPAGMGPPRSPGFGPGGPGGPNGMPPRGMPSPGMRNPMDQQGMMPRGPSPQSRPSPNMPPNVLQRGPQQPPFNGPPGAQPPQQMLSPMGGPRHTNGQGPPSPGHGPMPMRGPSPGPGAKRGPSTGPGPMHAPSPPGGQGPPGPNGFNRGPPPSHQRAAGPGFSDSPGPQKRQSLFRRSMAFFNGGSGPHGPAGQQGASDGAAPGGKRQSLFRRSMAFLGGGGAARSQPPAPQPDPVPRVKGFEDDVEKPDHSRKSQYLGASGGGFEWDTQGQGAKFWRRFSFAQKTAHSQKIEEGSKAWQETMATGRRKLIAVTVISLLIFVGTIVGIIVWREIVSPSGNSNTDQPDSLYHGNFGDGTTPSSTTDGTDANAKRAIPTGLARRMTYAREEEHRLGDAELVANILSSSLKPRADGPTKLLKRHRRRYHPSLEDNETPLEGSLADID
ncbi:hypothetical protein ACQY0O_004234 [Thecaphora frezii]